ncbi:MAG: histidine--tRNA ligase [Malacoplasma sp.]|nr:histidine--tRNA ligase [Malacoplasma sp.]
MIYQKPRGTFDLFGEEVKLFNEIKSTLKNVAEIFNFKEIITPIFENKELFVRNIGASSDIVTKEFYDFKDKSDRDLVLRPENTVGVIRSVVENKLLNTNPLPLKFFYFGPMFRYERPQKGRTRQFFQFGVECIGIKNVYQQVEMIIMSKHLLKELNVANYEIKINYIGNFETRVKWIEELKKYFSKYKNELTEDSINRLEKNPLRILDDKVDGKKDFVINAPKVEKFFSENEKEEFNKIKEILNFLNIDYQIDSTLVRGLDYYSGLVFEFVSTSNQLTGQSTLIGGGKYQNLLKEIGSSANYDCIGFALGVERIMLAVREENEVYLPNKIDVYVAAVGNTVMNAMKLVQDLRLCSISTESNYEISKLDKHFKYAEKFDPDIILILGEKELEENVVTLKIQGTQKTKKVKMDKVLEEVENICEKLMRDFIFSE